MAVLSRASEGEDVVTTKAKNARKARKRQSARAAERRVAHAVIHPVRLDALSILFERVASPKEIAKLLEVPLGTASFHVGELVTDDVIELVKTEPRRGAIEHFYRAKVKPEVSDAQWRKMPKASRRRIAALALQAIVADSLASLRHGKMDTDEQMRLVWIPMQLDTEGNHEVAALQAEVLDRLEDIKARSEARASEETEIAQVRIAAMMWFERGAPGGRLDGKPDLKKLEK
jgi:Helix-turn-helix domain